MNVLKRVKDRASFYYNCPKKSSTTIFSETLRYDSPTRGTAARYAGGLSEVMTLQGSTRNTYGFTYDAAGRLTTAKRFTETSGTSSSAAYTERGITYNRNGALLTLQRYGSSASTPQDDYSYTYSGPLLTGVTGKDSGTNLTASFAHDANGNTTADGRANLTFTYNLLNRPETVTSGNTTMATYHWLADGTKYQVEDASGNGVIYAGDLTYAVTVSSGNTTYALESAEASVDGTARFLKNGTAMTPYYTISDHLGSVRTIVNASGTVVERNDYYPFGTRTTFGASYPTLASNRQKFSGKEDQTTVASSTLPYLDFGARMYDAKLVRWNTYDPMAEKYYGINPYVYCNGDPENYIDPKGQSLIGWLLFYKAVAAGMEHLGRTSKVKTIGFIMQRPVSAALIGLPKDEKNNISSIASHFSINLTKQAGMEQTFDIGSPANALRHTIWQALITRELGERIAIRIGNAHEGIVERDDLIADSAVDQKNNIIGREIGLSSRNSSNEEIVRKVIEYFKEQGLWVFSQQTEGTIKVEQVKLTEDQYKRVVEELQKLNEYGKRK